MELYLTRYELEASSQMLEHVVRALGYLDDVDEDELLPERKAEIAAYWARRQPEIIRALGRVTER